MAFTTVVASESWSNNVSTVIAPTGGAFGSSGASTTGTLACSPCCSTGVKYLPGWFSYADPTRGLYDGLCPGAVDNSVPVTVYATFTLTPASGISLADYCIPSSFTIEMVANDPIYTSRLRPLSYATTCPPIYPSTRYGFLDITGKGYFEASVNTGSNPYIVMNKVDMCACNNVGYLRFSDAGSSYGTLNSCSPFSLTFSKNSPYGSSLRVYWQTTFVATYSITFTL